MMVGIKAQSLGIVNLSDTNLEGIHCGRHCHAMISHSLWDPETSEKGNFISDGSTILNASEGQFAAHMYKKP